MYEPSRDLTMRVSLFAAAAGAAAGAAAAGVADAAGAAASGARLVLEQALISKVRAAALARVEILCMLGQVLVG